jgi:2-polyprenyl-3-methyl-5-hydroxy-6-metoxy-1,4-benzoquinol methylase
MYETKQPWYFNFVRRDIEELLPAYAPRVLEVGCGAGATLAWLRDTGLAVHTTGVELAADAAAVARTRVDTLHEGSAEFWLARLQNESYDLVLCLDVLEHLVDPWAAMRRLHELVRPGGAVIVSLPNIRNHRVLLPLLFGGKWAYTDAGIMDRTHLRFFSHQTATDLLSQAGFDVDAETANGVRRGDRDYWKNAFSLGLFRQLFVFQHLMRGSRGLAQSPARSNPARQTSAPSPRLSIAN